MVDAPAIVVQLPGYPAEEFLSVETLAALRALSTSGFEGGENVLLEGSASVGDGFGGNYVWSPTSTATDDPPGVVRPNGIGPLQAGRWLAIGSSASGEFAAIPELATFAGRIRTNEGTDYVYDPDVDEEFVEANPLTATVSANGRGYRLATDQVIRPSMFGAGEDVADNSAALNAWALFMGKNPYVIGDWSGLFPIQNGIILGSTGARGPCTIIGKIDLKVTSEITADAVVINTMIGNFSDASISIYPGNDGIPYANRLFRHGVLTTGITTQQRWGAVDVSFAKGFGIFFNGNSPNNTFGNEIGRVSCYGCGSGFNGGVGEDEDIWSLNANYSGRVDSGTGLNQVSTFNVTTLPPTWQAEMLVLFVEIGPAREQIQVISIDRNASKITVQGWPATTLPATGTLRYIFGGAFGAIGGDAGILRPGHVIATCCGIGVQNSALYPGDIKFTTQQCSVGYVVGTGTSAAALGGSSIGYFEANASDIWALFSSETNLYCHKVEYQTALQLSKVRTFQPRHPSNNSKVYAFGVKGLEVSYAGCTHRWQNGPDLDGLWNRVTIQFDRPHQLYALRGNDATITLDNAYVYEGETTQSDFQRLFGYRSAEVSVTGTGTNGAPTSVTIVPPASRKINGGALGASLVITSWTGAARIHLEINPADNTQIFAYTVAGK